MKGFEIVEVDMSNGSFEEIGTCEVCFGSRWCDNPELTIESPDGERRTVRGYQGRRRDTRLS